MKLWILRHGQAEAQASADTLRELTEAGRHEVRAVMSGLAGEPFEAVLSSPYVRAQQTAELACQATGYSGDVTTVDWLVPESDPLTVISQLKQQTEQNLLLVSHQPLVSQLISLLVEGHRRGHFPMPTAGLVCLDLDYVAAGLARLVK
ncbi:phosphohistidine phosphatase SixA [Pseudomonas sp. OIL-1]|uniref:phosphohistidine phosphatase SixA n=1 Tax=Pseudomonas sp. OIL-1 TaxID=2706126 RepID=UPI0013A7866D|nr:phosphohistidine phosphatase SixA [Pseudomonas sp. OIL-1]QIB52015.1 phosphohistidine phosphatase SixA [Pseudomonas sp. OIL-1]